MCLFPSLVGGVGCRVALREWLLHAALIAPDWRGGYRVKYGLACDEEERASPSGMLRLERTA